MKSCHCCNRYCNIKIIIIIPLYPGSRTTGVCSTCKCLFLSFYNIYYVVGTRWSDCQWLAVRSIWFHPRPLFALHIVQSVVFCVVVCKPFYFCNCIVCHHLLAVSGYTHLLSSDSSDDLTSVFKQETIESWWLSLTVYVY